ncbi:maleylpyruvate isomerase family mycothiol-dependent enzyme [Aeromicrobium sp. Leaf350]|uniref:maleylpyruvate isomerase family mycothiol-dependent enzyme n=1 Tax=Aeromicrobium sp. Leaf350 TaxID=2876565 RepID=UPI001E655BDB|nr:maleylpyruvate isomerase family mycothiol-dependent enzyme [Aeromicrobium sp. Leaf350]
MDSQEMYVGAWKQAADAVVDLVPTLSAAQIAAPTDCPGWSVHDVVAHLEHLETVANGRPEPPAGIAIVASDYTEAGVAERRDVPTADLLASFREHTAQRHDFLTSTRLDLAETAPVTPAGVPWTWETLLRNRAVDLWVHEQDIRRAVGVPGDLSSLGAQVTTHTFAAGMGFVLGKKVKAPAGTMVRWLVTGGAAVTIELLVGEDGRARRAEPGTVADVTLGMTSEAFCVLAAGRRGPADVEVGIDGDAQLAAAVLGAMTLTF